MKNKTLLLLISTLMLCSCHKELAMKMELKLDKNSITIDAKGGEETVAISTNGEWSIENIPEWLSVMPSSGASTGSVSIEVRKNKSSSARKATLRVVCGDLSETIEVEQLSLMDSEPFMELSRISIQVISDETMGKVTITSNRPWNVTDTIPDWISIDPVSGTESADITVRVRENRDPKGRTANIRFSAGDLKATLAVKQYGLSESLVFPSLTIFPYKEMSFTSGMSEFGIKATEMFVNPSIKDKVYLGNLFAHNLLSNTNVPEFTGYTFNPITVSTSIATDGDKTKTYLPSLSGQEAFAKQIIDGAPIKNESFEHTDWTEFYDYKRLYSLGMVNMGVKLDEVVTGFPFLEKEMTKRYGLIYSFKRTFFSLKMDRPGKLIQEDLKETDKAKGVSYVSTITYGRIGFLIVESDTDSRDVKEAINKKLSDKPLSQEQTDLLSAVTISYIFFDNDNNIQMENDNWPDMINAYKDAMTTEATDNIYPVSFQLSDYADHSISTISYSINIPK